MAREKGSASGAPALGLKCVKCDEAEPPWSTLYAALVVEQSPIRFRSFADDSNWTVKEIE